MFCTYFCSSHKQNACPFRSPCISFDKLSSFISCESRVDNKSWVSVCLSVGRSVILTDGGTSIPKKQPPKEKKRKGRPIKRWRGQVVLGDASWRGDRVIRSLIFVMMMMTGKVRPFLETSQNKSTADWKWRAQFQISLSPIFEFSSQVQLS
jgi:hypothetical protein